MSTESFAVSVPVGRPADPIPEISGVYNRIRSEPGDSSIEELTLQADGSYQYVVHDQPSGMAPDETPPPDVMEHSGMSPRSLTRADSEVLTPGAWPSPMSAWRAQDRTDSMPYPSWRATR